MERIQRDGTKRTGARIDLGENFDGSRSELPAFVRGSEGEWVDPSRVDDYEKRRKQIAREEAQRKDEKADSR